MRLLIITQKIDQTDPILGFFHTWVVELAKRFENIVVICLQKGEFDLPSNVKVFSLGKEKKNELRIKNYKLWIKKFGYIFNFYEFIWAERDNYDAVFVHMNQEYVLLGGLFWQIWGKKVFMWRNHPKGNILTRIAVYFSDKVFYTAPNSYTARFNKSVKMPVGVDTSVFNTESRIMNYELSKNKILSLGRISPVKNIHIMVEAVKILKEKNIDFVFDIVGDIANPEDFDYKKKLATDSVNFMPAVPNHQTPEMYRSHEIFINLTESFDKTIIEAATCGALLIIANRSLVGEIDGSLITDDLSSKSVATRLEYWLKAEEDEKEKMRQKLIKYVSENHSLKMLINKLCLEVS